MNLSRHPSHSQRNRRADAESDDCLEAFVDLVVVGETTSALVSVAGSSKARPLSASGLDVPLSRGLLTEPACERVVAKELLRSTS
jgi:hypothetical protein